jgi:aminopeptidase N
LDDRGGVLVLGERVPVDVVGALTQVPSLAGSVAPEALILDPGDLTWAKGRLDDRSLRAVTRAGVWRIEDPLVRARIWMLLRDLVLDAEIPVVSYLPMMLDGVARDPDPGIASVLIAHALDAIGRLGRRSERRTRTAQLAERCIGALALADGPDHQLVFARGAIEAATEPDQVDLVRGWLDGRDVPGGLAIGPDERWSATRRLAVLGEADRHAIDEEARRDATATGRERAVMARASVAAPDAKEEAWEAIVGTGDLAYTLRWRMALGFGPPEHDDLVRPFVPRMVPALVDLWGNMAPFGAALVSSAVLQAAPIEASTRDAMDEALGSSGIPPGLHRILVEQRWELARAMDARALDR